MEHAVALPALDGHGPGPGPEEEYTTTGIPHDKMGMWVFLCSEVMFFTGLIGSYIVLRFATPLWPVPGTVLNIPLTAFNTFILICSSVTMVQALAAVQRGDLRKTKLFLCLTVLGGAFFLSIQAIEYWKLLHEGFNPHVSLFGSIFFTTTGFHGFHVLCGVICMAFVTGKALLGKYTQASHLGIETIGLYWHFVDLVWIVLFTIIYLF
ncbi:MAG TPA: heme-copper oxidase subunit III [Thermoanaerobaculia bacterium]|nr:heme-copper oxidase subunit III [Thermoanaerobaculia bacterium]